MINTHLKKLSTVIRAIENDVEQDSKPISKSLIIASLFSSFLLTLTLVVIFPVCVVFDLFFLACYGNQQPEDKSLLLCFCASYEDDLVSAALGSKDNVKTFHFKTPYSFFSIITSLAPFTTPSSCLVIIVFLRSLIHFFKYQNSKLLIRSFAALELAPMSYIADKSNCLTTDHYQRYFYLLAHIASSLSIVQHGIPNQFIRLPHSISSPISLKCVYVRASEFIYPFSNLYKINPAICKVISYTRSLEPYNPIPQSICLFSWASRFPQEVILLSSILKLAKTTTRFNDLKIFIMLHPAHSYKKYSQTLKSLPFTIVPTINQKLPIPNCRVYLVHLESFVQYELPQSSNFFYIDKVTPSNILQSMLSL